MNSLYMSSLRSLPPSSYEALLCPSSALTLSMRFDLFQKLFREGRQALLARHLSRADILLPLLQLWDKRVPLHFLFQTVVVPLMTAVMMVKEERRKHLSSCMRFASFLSEAGWFQKGEDLLRHVLEQLGEEEDMMTMECNLILLRCLCSFAKFSQAEVVYRLMLKTLDQKERSGTPLRFCLPALFSEFSYYCYLRSQFDVSYDWSMEALRLLGSSPPQSTRTVVDVLRAAGKSCVGLRKFSKAELLTRESMLLAKEVYGEGHLKYAECVADFGYYLLNTNSFTKGFQAYQEALKVRIGCFGDSSSSSNNLIVALSHTDLAFATYAKENSSEGHFNVARTHAERSLKIMSELLRENSFLLANSSKVLAQILQEIASMHTNKTMKKQMHLRAEQLYERAQHLTVSAFGKESVQTARLCGNLGGLYRDMDKVLMAKKLHVHAIDIKEKLGRDAYEVALSIRPLAFLMSVDLKEFSKAECLYLRTIDICLTLDNPFISDLQQDYEGLIRIYSETGQFEKCFEYAAKLRDCKEVHELWVDSSASLSKLKKKDSQPIGKIVSSITADVESKSVKDLLSAAAAADPKE